MAASGSTEGHFARSWRRLPENVRAAAWITIGTIFFASNDALVKSMGAEIHPVQMALFRYAIGFILLTPMFIRLGSAGLATKRPGMHFMRALIAGVGQAGVFYAVVHLKLANATAISFSRPLFVTVLAVLILGETVGWRRWTATLVGFGGVLVMLRPGQIGIDPASIVAVVCALLFGLGLILIRFLARTEPAPRILFYYHAFGVLMFAGPAAWLWAPPTAFQWFLLLMIGVLTTAAMVCFVRGFTIGEASVVGPMEYTRLVYAALIGFFIFSEVPDAGTWIGAAIIVASTIYIARHEAKAGGRAPIG
jgi:drug/metabolite transporter (DMT)-like permease